MTEEKIRRKQGEEQTSEDEKQREWEKGKRKR
jgi:hypothetical protein